MHRFRVYEKLYELCTPYDSPPPGPENTIVPSWLLSTSDRDVSPGYWSISSSNITAALKVVSLADMLDSAEVEGDGLFAEGDWDTYFEGENFRAKLGGLQSPLFFVEFNPFPSHYFYCSPLTPTTTPPLLCCVTFCISS